MTTIAFDGRFVAADRGQWSDNIVEEGAKLFKMEPSPRFPQGVVITVCGYVGAVEPLIAHILYNDPFDFKKYNLEPYEITGLLCSHDGVYKICGDGRLSLTDCKFHANGSGFAFAFGALAAGASAKRTVELAMQYTDSAKHGVDVVDLREMFPDAKLYRL